MAEARAVRAVMQGKASVKDVEVKASTTQETKRKTGLEFRRYFTDGKTHPFDRLEWEERTAQIGNEKGVTIFKQEDVEVPKAWSQTATNIVASKYFHGKLGTSEREGSVRQLITRVVDATVRWGEQGGYFVTPQSRDAFRDELTHLLVEQKMAFNSPVWFNVGVQAKPQCSACFINSVKDDMVSIMNLAKTEGMLFKYGSGTGSNLSPLREEDGQLSGGGKASGPLSFMKGFDAFAGVIKSGGKTRRAAKMVILNAEHPDVEKFIWCKAKEEKKAHTLIEAGFDASLDGEAYSSVFFQNANNSVRATDEFMRAVVEDRDWWTRSVGSGTPVKRYRARDLMRELADATWQCGDPGMQFDTTVNRWHTSKASGRINASNPCSEYMFLDDSACNLASLNLVKFVGPNGQFDVVAFRHAVDTLIAAMEIIVENASYPTAKIAKNSRDFRPLGLGYANLGALLMSQGIAYDSDQGRAWAAGITAVLCGQAYLTSARIAEAVGTFPEYAKNEESFLEVIRMHRDSVPGIDSRLVPQALYENARACWEGAYEQGRQFGFRNAQATVIAPTGTIGFMMDCDTTGIEPELALIKHKKLVGGGIIKIVNTIVPEALIKLGYRAEQAEAIVSHIDATGTVEGAPHLKAEHLSVFDTSFKPANGTRYIHHMGHVKMMASVQPFISGAISKTINMPQESSVEDIMDAYVESWRLGIKAVAIYRDGSKWVQPLSSGKGDAKGDSKALVGTGATTSTEVVKAVETIVYRPVRRKLPDERQSITHKFSIAGHEGYITVGLFEDGLPGELFVRMAKEGSTISGLMDSFATAVSYGLQYGVPLKFYVDKFSHVRFEPSGWTGNKQIPYAKSIMDYIFRWLGGRFIGPEEMQGEAGGEMLLKPTEQQPQQALPFEPKVAEMPICAECGSMMVPNGSCYKCENCGGTSGCS